MSDPGVVALLADRGTAFASTRPPMVSEANAVSVREECSSASDIERDINPLDDWLSQLLDQIPVAHDGQDARGVHQVRIALGRIRVWLMLTGEPTFDKDLRWLRRRAGFVRDLDVQLHRDLPGSWRRKLKTKRLRAQLRFARALDSPRTTKLLAALSRLPPVPRHHATPKLLELFTRLIVLGEALPRKEADTRGLHAFRRADRRVRYALEWFGEDASTVIRLQEVFGDAFDDAVALDRLGSKRGGGLRTYRKALRRALHRKTNLALSEWRRLRPTLRTFLRFLAGSDGVGIFGPPQYSGSLAPA